MKEPVAIPARPDQGDPNPPPQYVIFLIGGQQYKIETNTATAVKLKVIDYKEIIFYNCHPAKFGDGHLMTFSGIAVPSALGTISPAACARGSWLLSALIHSWHEYCKKAEHKYDMANFSSNWITSGLPTTRTSALIHYASSYRT